MTYDHWKTTEPESGYDPPEPSIEETYDREMGQMEARLRLLRETAFSIMAERDKYKAALRKIAGWEGFTLLTDYERGVNDTLKQMAKKALS